MRGKALKLTISILLIVSVLCSSISVFADNEPEVTVPPGADNTRVDAQLDLVSYYIYLMLNSWGIEVKFGDVSEFNYDVKNWIIDMMFDYAVDLGISAVELIAPWIIEFDFWNNIQVNDRCVKDVEAFGQWLIQKFNLTNNSSVIIGEGTSVGGVKCYKFPIYIVLHAPSGQYPNRELVALDSYAGSQVNDVYFIPVTNDGTVIGIVFSPVYQSVTLRPRSGNVYDNPYEQFGLYFHEVDYPTNSGNYYDVSPWYVNNVVPLNLNPPTSGYSYELMDGYESTDIVTALNALGNPMVADDGVIDSDVIILPSNDVDYQDGDGMIIYPDGSIAYLIINWPDSINVANLPAVISTNKIDNPGLIEAWRPINALVTYVAQPIGAIRSLIYEMPEEIVIVFDAFIGAIVLFGMIKLLREH